MIAECEVCKGRIIFENMNVSGGQITVTHYWKKDIEIHDIVLKVKKV